MQKHDTASNNPNQITRLTLPGFVIELKTHFRNKFIVVRLKWQFAYINAFAPVPWSDVIGNPVYDCFSKLYIGSYTVVIPVTYWCILTLPHVV